MATVPFFYQEQLLALLFHHMSQDTRRLVMRELPQAYNAYVGREVVKVHYSEEGRGEVEPPPGNSDRQPPRPLVPAGADS